MEESCCLPGSERKRCSMPWRGGAALVGLIIGWFVTKPLANLLSRLAFQRPVASEIMPLIRVIGAVGLAVLLYFTVPAGTGDGLGGGSGGGGGKDKSTARTRAATRRRTRVARTGTRMTSASIRAKRRRTSRPISFALRSSEASLSGQGEVVSFPAKGPASG